MLIGATNSVINFSPNSLIILFVVTTRINQRNYSPDTALSLSAIRTFQTNAYFTPIEYAKHHDEPEVEIFEVQTQTTHEIG